MDGLDMRGRVILLPLQTCKVCGGKMIEMWDRSRWCVDASCAGSKKGGK